MENNKPKKTLLQVSKELNIPTRTLNDWKHRDRDNWRYKLYIKLCVKGE